MLNHYLKIPLETHFFDEDTLSQQQDRKIKNLVLTFETHRELVHAIRQNIELLLLSQEGELAFDNVFGLEIWNHNYESKILRHEERKNIEQEVINDLNKYEPRLKKNSHKVEIQFKDEVKLINGKNARVNVFEIRINSVLDDEFKSKQNEFSHVLKVPVKIYYKT